MLVGVATGLFVQLVKGYTPCRARRISVWYIIPAAIDGLQIAILAVFVQVLSPNKYVGWGMMLRLVRRHDLPRQYGLFEHSL